MDFWTQQGKVRVGMNGGGSIDIYTHLCKINSGKSLQNTGSPPWGSVMTYRGWDGGS